VPVAPKLQSATSVERKKTEIPKSVSHTYPIGDRIDVDPIGDDFVDTKLGLVLHNLKATRDYQLLP
jgi:hypothetical protein